MITTTTFFSHVLDDPLYVSDGMYVSVVTSGKVNNVGQTRDVSKDAAAKAGLIKIDTNSKTSHFIDFNILSEPGDRYRGAVEVDGIVYVMRTQKKHVDSIVRLAAVDLKTNLVEMIEERAVSVHGTETPKTFCGHFNFGRPIIVGKKIVYPPLNSGVAIVFDTVTRSFVAHDVPDTYSSIWSTYLSDTNEVVFFPYGNKTTELLVLNLTTNTHSFKQAPVASTFYSAFTHNGKAIGVPYIMGEKTNTHFWIYDGSSVSAIEYVPSSGVPSAGFKYGSVNDNIFYTHTCAESNNELIEFNLNAYTIKNIKTDLPLGAKPISINGNTYLFPSIQNTAMLDAPNSVYKLENGQVVKEFDLPTNNISYGPINSNQGSVLFVPYKFDLNNGKLDSVLTLINLESKTANTIDISLELE
jgi:hypothetical protein